MNGQLTLTPNMVLNLSQLIPYHTSAEEKENKLVE